MKTKVDLTWGPVTIEADKRVGRPGSLYPDMVLWGVAVNGICNPSLITVLDELAKGTGEVEEVETIPAPQPKGIRATVGRLLVSWGNRLLNK